MESEDGSEALTGVRIVDYLREELAERLAERIEVGRTSVSFKPSHIMSVTPHI